MTTQGVSCVDLERWMEINTFICPLSRTHTRISPEQCAANRKKPPLGKSSVAVAIHGGGVMVNSGGYRPEACARCTEYDALCQAVFNRRKGLKGDDMAKITEKEWIRTAAELQKASSTEEAAAALGIGKSTLAYRISQNPKLQKICDDKGFGPKKRKISLDELRSKLPPEKKKETGAESQHAEPERPAAMPVPGELGAVPRAPGGIDPLSEVITSTPSVKIIIQVEGLDLDRLSGFLHSLQGAQDVGVIHTRV